MTKTKIVSVLVHHFPKNEEITILCFIDNKIEDTKILFRTSSYGEGEQDLPYFVNAIINTGLIVLCGDHGLEIFFNEDTLDEIKKLVERNLKEEQLEEKVSIKFCMKELTAKQKKRRTVFVVNKQTNNKGKHHVPSCQERC